ADRKRFIAIVPLSARRNDRVVGKHHFLQTRSLLRMLEQGADRFAFCEPVGTAGTVVDFGGRVDAEAPEEGGGKVAGGHRVGGGEGADLVAGTVNGTTADTATGQDHRVTVRPVIPAGGLVDLRCAPELPQADDERGV